MIDQAVEAFELLTAELCEGRNPAVSGGVKPFEPFAFPWYLVGVVTYIIPQEMLLAFLELSTPTLFKN